MDTISVCRFACGDSFIRRGFGGVFASDVLPQFKNNFNSFIINLDPQSLPGSHWVAVFFDGETASYFDSYGRTPPTDILNFIRRNSSLLTHNKYCYQDYFTLTCGYFCLYFLFKKSRKLNLTELSKVDKTKNERFIHRFSNRLKLGNCCHSFHAVKQSCAAIINMQAI